ERQPLAGEPLGEVLALQPLHREEGLPVGGDAVGDVGDDAAVGEVGEERRLAGEAPGLVDGVSVEDLHRDGPLGGEIAPRPGGAPPAALVLGLEREAAAEERIRLTRGGHPSRASLPSRGGGSYRAAIAAAGASAGGAGGGATWGATAVHFTSFRSRTKI